MTEEYFHELVKQWEKDTQFSGSSIAVDRKHPAFQEIVTAGMEVVPYILQLLRRRKSHIVAALPLITGVDPVPKEHRGIPDLMVADWLSWGEENHILQKGVR